MAQQYTITGLTGGGGPLNLNGRILRKGDVISAREKEQCERDFAHKAMTFAPVAAAPSAPASGAGDDDKKSKKG